MRLLALILVLVLLTPAVAVAGSDSAPAADSDSAPESEPAPDSESTSGPTLVPAPGPDPSVDSLFALSTQRFSKRPEDGSRSCCTDRVRCHAHPGWPEHRDRHRAGEVLVGERGLARPSG